MTGLRVAILAHSTNPRGGVVHALELGDALMRLGHHVVVHAPDPACTGFFRETLCDTACVPASPVGRDMNEMVRIRAQDYLTYFASAARRRFDVWHAQDGISANALATLAEDGAIPGFVRTVHHVDNFVDPALAARERRSITAARRLLVVSRRWRDWLAENMGRRSSVVGNGVDSARYSPTPDATDAELRTRLGPADRPMFLAVGGVEARKNTLGILEAFRRIRARIPARLVIAGGASLLDHGAYQTRFADALAASGLPADAVTLAGKLPDRLMPALFRAATALVFPSIKEGFGLVVLEAMASGVPVVASRIPPFTEYLDADDVFWCEPTDAASIAAAMLMAREPRLRAPLIAAGLRKAAGFGWDRVARAHLDEYAAMLEAENA